MSESLEGAVGLQKAAELYDVSVDTLRAAYRSGLLPVRYQGKKILVSRTDLKAWFEALPTERTA